MYLQLDISGVKRTVCQQQVSYEGKTYCVDGMGIKNNADFERIDKLGETKIKDPNKIEWVEESR